ncbi:MAG: CBS domain-containing protein [Candidatus Bathyarchaeia archaeon]
MATVKSVMHEATFIDSDTPVNSVARIMRDKSIGSVLLKLGEHEYGVVTERDLIYKVTANNLDPKKTTARDIMTELRYTLDGNASIKKASEIFNKHRIRRLPIMEAGEIVGVVTSRDVAKASIFQSMKSRRRG